MRPDRPGRAAVLGVDVGTSSSKGVLVDLDGRVLRSSTIEHEVDRPAPGMVEMDAIVWSDELVLICRELLVESAVDVVAVGVSGMGPCLLLTDEIDQPLRPAILYGVDTRSSAQIARLDDRFGARDIQLRGGSLLSSQAAGAKLAWVSDEEPEIFTLARRMYLTSSWLVRWLTGVYVLDHHSASQCTPLYDSLAMDWYRPWAEEIAPRIELPPLLWPGESAGTVTAEASAATGLRSGIPVTVGTIDAWSEAVSVGAQMVGDLMLMYGTTMFLIHTVPERLLSDGLWSTVGVLPGTRNLAGGMAASGAITGWLRELFGAVDYPELLALADRSGVGANGLLLLPYFAGERTPIMDPEARGVLAGLRLEHTRGDLYRAALEATAYGVRHNIEAIEGAGGDIRRVVAAGGGTRGRLWTQIVSDVTGREQEIRTHTIGASYGAALLAAQLVSDADVDVWNPVAEVVAPRPETADAYNEMYGLYRDLYRDCATVTHALADIQKRRTSATIPSPRGANYDRVRDADSGSVSDDATSRAVHRG
jgi:xylulokinase